MLVPSEQTNGISRLEGFLQVERESVVEQIPVFSYSVRSQERFGFLDLLVQLIERRLEAHSIRSSITGFGLDEHGTSYPRCARKPAWRKGFYSHFDRSVTVGCTP